MALKETQVPAPLFFVLTTSTSSIELQVVRTISLKVPLFTTIGKMRRNLQVEGLDFPVPIPSPPERPDGPKFPDHHYE